MTMTDHERIEMITEARMFALAAPIILPLIEKRKKFALEKLLTAHRDGRTETATIVAELAVLADLEREINQKESMYRTLEGQHAKSERK